MKRYSRIQRSHKKAVVVITLFVFLLMFSSCISKPKQSVKPTEQNLLSQAIEAEEECTEEEKESEKTNTDTGSDLSELEQTETNMEENAQDREDQTEEPIAEETTGEQRIEKPEESSNVIETIEVEGPTNGGGIELPDDPIEN